MRTRISESDAEDRFYSTIDAIGIERRESKLRDKIVSYFYDMVKDGKIDEAEAIRRVRRAFGKEEVDLGAIARARKELFE